MEGNSYSSILTTDIATLDFVHSIQRLRKFFGDFLACSTTEDYTALTADGRSMLDITESLLKLYQTTLTASGEKKKPKINTIRPVSDSDGISICKTPLDGDNEPSISAIPLELLANTFSHLDIHHQARAYRVCRMWNGVISECWPLEHVEINCQLKHDSHVWTGRNDLDSEEAKLDAMLHVALSDRTKSLTLYNIALSHRRITFLIVNRFKERTQKLPVLCFKNSTAEAELSLYPWLKPIELRNYNYSSLLLFLHHQPCGKVLLCNYTIKDIMHYDILFNPNLRFIEGMLRKFGSAGTVSRLIVDCGKSSVDVFRSLLSALNADWPSADEDFRTNVIAVYHHWMQNDNYPHSWAFRLVNLFTYHCADPFKLRPKNYEDRKGQSIAQLNDMTTALLALFFTAYDANY